MDVSQETSSLSQGFLVQHFLVLIVTLVCSYLHLALVEVERGRMEEITNMEVVVQRVLIF